MPGSTLAARGVRACRARRFPAYRAARNAVSQVYTRDRTENPVVRRAVSGGLTVTTRSGAGTVVVGTRRQGRWRAALPSTDAVRRDQPASVTLMLSPTFRVVHKRGLTENI